MSYAIQPNTVIGIKPETLTLVTRSPGNAARIPSGRTRGALRGRCSQLSVQGPQKLHLKYFFELQKSLRVSFTVTPGITVLFLPSDAFLSSALERDRVYNQPTAACHAVGS
jgi:hypothetical protein